MNLIPRSPLVIAGVAIRQDAEGRFCLNDFHKAAGELKHQQPAKFFANDSASELVGELRRQSPNSEIDPVKTVRGGKTPGTFVCKQLVYAYATWISPAFFLQVINTFDAVVTGDVAVLPAPIQALIAQEVQAGVRKALDEFIPRFGGVVKSVGGRASAVQNKFAD